MRHCSFTRMLYWPARRPRSICKRFEGGALRSARVAERFSIRSLRKATRWISGGRFVERCLEKMRSASLNDRLMALYVRRSALNANRYIEAGGGRARMQILAYRIACGALARRGDRGFRADGQGSPDGGSHAEVWGAGGRLKPGSGPRFAKHDLEVFRRSNEALTLRRWPPVSPLSPWSGTPGFLSGLPQRRPGDQADLGRGPEPLCTGPDPFLNPPVAR